METDYPESFVDRPTSHDDPHAALDLSRLQEFCHILRQPQVDDDGTRIIELNRLLFQPILALPDRNALLDILKYIVHEFRHLKDVAPFYQHNFEALFYFLRQRICKNGASIIFCPQGCTVQYPNENAIHFSYDTPAPPPRVPEAALQPKPSPTEPITPAPGTTTGSHSAAAQVSPEHSAQVFDEDPDTAYNDHLLRHRIQELTYLLTAATERDKAHLQEMVHFLQLGLRPSEKFTQRG
jgi:hypothetical protein